MEGYWFGANAAVMENVVKPALVGKDTQMHELMIFFGTLGGIAMFGIAGIFIGPVIASLFVTIWDIYGITFRDYLPAVYSRGGDAPASESESASWGRKTGRLLFSAN